MYVAYTRLSTLKEKYCLWCHIDQFSFSNRKKEFSIKNEFNMNDSNAMLDFMGLEFRYSIKFRHGMADEQ